MSASNLSSTNATESASSAKMISASLRSCRIFCRPVPFLVAAAIGLIQQRSVVLSAMLIMRRQNLSVVFIDNHKSMFSLDDLKRQLVSHRLLPCRLEHISHISEFAKPTRHHYWGRFTGRNVPESERLMISSRPSCQAPSIS